MGPARSPVALPPQIGPFRIIRLIGHGGMGAVYEAEQVNPRRPVALKVIKSGYVSSQLLKRFEQEAHILGRLQYSGIAQIYQAGVADAGHGLQPYFAMELVDGLSLTRYALHHGLGTRQRMELLSRIADAVQHAHAKGVIHRDLKPGNILVTADGQPKVLDFGVARATDSDLQVTTLQTDIGQIVGTLPYMSPEQVTGDPNELDTRSDVYALGVILYELLVDRLPHDVNRRATLEAIRVIREQEPTRLSSINRTLRGDVETIVGKAMEKDKTRRYQTASALADDIRRYLADEPIAARPPSTTYQIHKFAQRNKALVGGLLAVVLALTGGIIAASWQALRARRAEAVARLEAERARTQAAKAEQVAAFSQSILSGVDPTIARGKDTQLLHDILDRAAERIDAELANQPEVAAAIHLTIGKSYRNISEFGPAETHLRAAEKSHTALLGADARDTLRTRVALTMLLARQGKLTEAEAIVRPVVDAARRALGPDDRDTLEFTSELANVLARAKKLDEADALIRRTLERQKSLFGDDDKDVLDSMFILSNCLWAQQKSKEAVDVARSLAAARERKVGKDHSDAITALGSLAMMLSAAGESQASLETYEDTLARARRVFGPHHQSTLTILHNYGIALRGAHRPAEGETVLREALEGRQRVLGEDHPETISTLTVLTNSLLDQRQSEQALAMAQRAVAAARRRFGDDSDHTLPTMSNLARALRGVGKRREAADILGQIARTSRKLPAGSRRDVAMDYYNWAAVLQDLGDYEATEPVFVELIGLWEKAGKKDINYMAAALHSYAKSLAHRGDFAAAEPYFQQGLAMRRRLYPSGHIELYYSLGDFGAALLVQGAPTHAEPLLREALECVRVAKPLRPDRVAEITGLLGQALLDQNRFAAAEPLLLESTESLKEVKGATDADRRQYYKRMVTLYENWNAAEPDAEREAKAQPWTDALAKLPPDQSTPPAAELKPQD